MNLFVLQLLERVVREHPHHSLSVVLALAHANKDQELLTAKSGRSGARLARQQQQQKQDEVRHNCVKVVFYGCY